MRSWIESNLCGTVLNEKSTGPADGHGEELSGDHECLTLLEREDLKEHVYRGSTEYLPSETEPVISDAAKDLAKRAMDYTEEHPLYVVAIAAITNVASALLLNPDIKNRIVLIWLGGNATNWPDNKEFNLYQDVAGARIVFGCWCAACTTSVHGRCICIYDERTGVGVSFARKK